MVKLPPNCAMRAWEECQPAVSPRHPHPTAYGATTVSKHYPHIHATLSMICTPESDYVWRVHMLPRGRVEIKYIGYNPIDEERTKVYSTFEEIPEWIRGRVAVLQMMPADPQESVVFGVGRRVSEDVYWVVQ